MNSIEDYVPSNNSFEINSNSFSEFDEGYVLSQIHDFFAHFDYMRESSSERTEMLRDHWGSVAELEADQNPDAEWRPSENYTPPILNLLGETAKSIASLVTYAGKSVVSNTYSMIPTPVRKLTGPISVTSFLVACFGGQVIPTIVPPTNPEPTPTIKDLESTLTARKAESSSQTSTEKSDQAPTVDATVAADSTTQVVKNGVTIKYDETNSNGIAVFKDNTTGQTVTVEVVDDSSKPLGSMLVQYMYSEDFERFIVKDPDNQYAPSFRINRHDTVPLITTFVSTPNIHIPITMQTSDHKIRKGDLAVLTENEWEHMGRLTPEQLDAENMIYSFILGLAGINLGVASDGLGKISGISDLVSGWQEPEFYDVYNVIPASPITTTIRVLVPVESPKPKIPTINSDGTYDAYLHVQKSRSEFQDFLREKLGHDLKKYIQAVNADNEFRYKEALVKFVSRVFGDNYLRLQTNAVESDFPQVTPDYFKNAWESAKSENDFHIPLKTFFEFQMEDIINQTATTAVKPNFKILTDTGEIIPFGNIDDLVMDGESLDKLRQEFSAQKETHPLEWTMHRGPHNSGYIDVELKFPLVKEWEIEFESDIRLSPAAILGNKLFVGDSSNYWPGKFDPGRLLVLSAENGEIQREIEIRHSRSGHTPAVTDDRVIFFGGGGRDFSSGRSGPDLPSYLYAIDTKSGEEMWKIRMHVAKNPIIDGKTIYITSSSNPNIRSLNAQDGEEYWKFNTEPDPNPILTTTTGNPIIKDGVIYFTNSGFFKTDLYAVTENGNLRWMADVTPELEGVRQIIDRSRSALALVGDNLIWSYYTMPFGRRSDSLEGRRGIPFEACHGVYDLIKGEKTIDKCFPFDQPHYAKIVSDGKEVYLDMDYTILRYKQGENGLRELQPINLEDPVIEMLLTRNAIVVSTNKNILAIDRKNPDIRQEIYEQTPIGPLNLPTLSANISVSGGSLYATLEDPDKIMKFSNPNAFVAREPEIAVREPGWAMHEGPFNSGYVNADINLPLEKEWSVEVVGHASQTAISQGKIFVSDLYDLKALSTQNGEEVWKAHVVVSPNVATPTVKDNILIVPGRPGPFSKSELSTSELEEILFALDLRTGEELWNQKIPASFNIPIIDNDSIYTIKRIDSGQYPFSRIQSRDVNNGELNWDYMADGLIYSIPVVRGDSIYFASDLPKSSEVYALSKDGKLKWKADATPKLGKRDYNYYDLGKHETSILAGNILFWSNTIRTIESRDSVSDRSCIEAFDITTKKLVLDDCVNGFFDNYIVSDGKEVYAGRGTTISRYAVDNGALKEMPPIRVEDEILDLLLANNVLIAKTRENILAIDRKNPDVMHKIFDIKSFRGKLSFSDGALYVTSDGIGRNDTLYKLSPVGNTK